jgi:mannose/fructose/sorbose-specific phosphotransferase system IIA component
MIHIIVVAHGGLADEMVGSVEMIIGSVPGLHPVGLAPSENLEEYERKVRAVINKTVADADNDGIIILADMFGGSCANVGAKIASDYGTDSIAVITGVNLPMLLDTIVNRDVLNFEALKKKILDAGSRSIIDMSQMERKTVES